MAWALLSRWVVCGLSGQSRAIQLAKAGANVAAPLAAVPALRAAVLSCCPLCCSLMPSRLGLLAHDPHVGALGKWKRVVRICEPGDEVQPCVSEEKITDKLAVG